MIASLIAKTDTDYLRFVKHQSETLIGILLPQISGWNMMKRGDHPNRTARHRNVRPTFEKTVHNLCPNCGSSEFTVYFESGSPRKVGALCYSCGTVGFFARNNFFELGRVSKGTKLTSSHRIARIAGR
jgi:predicted RNA-binding Zn-ribbon protein involved in translation (DUF1610 family)